MQIGRKCTIYAGNSKYNSLKFYIEIAAKPVFGTFSCRFRVLAIFMGRERTAVADILRSIREGIQEGYDVLAIEENLMLLEQGSSGLGAFLRTFALGDGEIIFFLAILLHINILHTASSLHSAAVKHFFRHPSAIWFSF